MAPFELFEFFENFLLLVREADGGFDDHLNEEVPFATSMDVGGPFPADVRSAVQEAATGRVKDALHIPLLYIYRQRY